MEISPFPSLGFLETPLYKGLELSEGGCFTLTQPEKWGRSERAEFVDSLTKNCFMPMKNLLRSYVVKIWPLFERFLKLYCEPERNTVNRVV